MLIKIVNLLNITLVEIQRFIMSKEMHNRLGQLNACYVSYQQVTTSTSGHQNTIKCVNMLAICNLL